MDVFADFGLCFLFAVFVSILLHLGSMLVHLGLQLHAQRLHDEPEKHNEARKIYKRLTTKRFEKLNPIKWNSQINFSIFYNQDEGPKGALKP